MEDSWDIRKRKLEKEVRALEISRESQSLELSRKNLELQRLSEDLDLKKQEHSNILSHIEDLKRIMAARKSSFEKEEKESSERKKKLDDLNAVLRDREGELELKRISIERNLKEKESQIGKKIKELSRISDDVEERRRYAESKEAGNLRVIEKLNLMKAQLQEKERDLLQRETLIKSSKKDIDDTIKKLEDERKNILLQQENVDAAKKRLLSELELIKEKKLEMEKLNSEFYRKRQASVSEFYQFSEQVKMLTEEKQELSKKILAMKLELGKQDQIIAEKEAQVKAKESMALRKEEELKSKISSIEARMQEALMRESEMKKKLDQVERDLERKEKEIEMLQEGEEIFAKKIMQADRNRDESLSRLKMVLKQKSDNERQNELLKQELKRLSEELSKSKRALEEIQQSTQSKAAEKDDEKLKEALEKIRQLEATQTNSSETQDLVKALKIADKLLQKLPPDVINAFVNSDDFVFFEEVFSKHNIS